MHIELSVSGQRLRREMGPGIVGGSRYYLTAHVAFAGHDWDGAQVWLKIDKDGAQNAYLLDADGCVTADRGINLPAGQYTMSLLGLRDNMRITTNEVPLCVLVSGADGGDPLPEIPQTAAEQIALLAQEAVDTARSVREDADAGDFNGAPGKNGVSAEHKWNGSVLTITSASGTSSADLRGPQGTEGKQGPQGPQGVKGQDAPQDAVRYGEQALDEAQKAKARGNIGAASDAELSRVKDDLVDLESDILCRTGQLYNIDDPDNFVDRVMSINSSDKCVFYGSNNYPYRSIIFPLLDISDGGYGVAFTSNDNSISNVKISCFSEQPAPSSGDFVAANTVYATGKENFTALLPYSKDNPYIVIQFGFKADFSDIDSAFEQIKKSLYVFHSEKTIWNDVDWSNVDYEKYLQLALPDSMKQEIENKVDKVAGKGLSTNDFTDSLKAGLERIVGFDEIISKYGDSGITDGAWTQPTTGNVLSTDNTRIYSTTELIPCNVGDSLYLCNVQSLVFFKEDKTYSTGVTISASTISDYTGRGFQNNYTIVDQNAKYMAVNFYNANYSSNNLNGRFAVCRRNATPYKILNLGDSIFGLNPKPYDASTKIQNVTGQKTANCGFGGTRASTHPTSDYAKFSFHALADAIYAEDFSNQEGGDFTVLGGGFYYRYNLNTLESIDFSKLSAVTLAYGTNDWNANVPIDGDNKIDITTFKGALRYGIEKIISKYPKIQIVILSPIYRTFSSEQMDSDTKQNSNGNKLIDFVTACKEISEEYHLPFIDNYNNLGINKFNSTYFLRDETHLTFDVGADRLGAVTGGFLSKYVN